jgi:HSP20 family molecular chaperone IbpA
MFPGDFFGENPSRWDHGAGPGVQVRDSEKCVAVEFEVPRFRSDDLKIDADTEAGEIVVSGRREAQEDGDSFVYGTATPDSFRRVFTFSTRDCDVSKFTTKLDSGVLTITVPKFPPAQEAKSVQLFGGDKDGKLVTTSTPDQLKAIRNATWPPNIQTEDTPEALTYKIQMPASVSQDHITLSRQGRNLSLSIGYDYTVKAPGREESQSLQYSTSLGLPRGTVNDDISTKYENGSLTVTVTKHGSDAKSNAKKDAKSDSPKK